MPYYLLNIVHSFFKEKVLYFIFGHDIECLKGEGMGSYRLLLNKQESERSITA